MGRVGLVGIFAIRDYETSIVEVDRSRRIGAASIGLGIFASQIQGVFSAIVCSMHILGVELFDQSHVVSILWHVERLSESEASCGNSRLAVALYNIDRIHFERRKETDIQYSSQCLLVAIFKALNELLVGGILDEEMEAYYGDYDDGVSQCYKPFIVLSYRHVVQ